MIKFWKYYVYYFCTLWRRPLVWLLTGGMIYAQYEKDLLIQAMIYVGFTFLLPLAVACERVRADYELEDIANDLSARDIRKSKIKTAAAAPSTTGEEPTPYDWSDSESRIPETFGGDNSQSDDIESDRGSD